MFPSVLWGGHTKHYPMNEAYLCPPSYLQNPFFVFKFTSMSLNCNEINLILSELDLAGSFIQDIVQPGFDTVAFYTFGEHGARTVIVCTAPSSCRINETRRKIVKNEKPLRFMEILKSRIKGSRIESAKQLGLMRIILLELRHGEERFRLYIRLWSGAANVILCDEENRILDTMFRRPLKGEISGKVFELPELEDTSGGKEWHIRDFSASDFESMGANPNGRNDFSSLTFNEKIDLWYSENAASLSRKALIAQAEKWYSQTKAKMLSALEKLECKKEEFENSGNLKHQGDLILSNASLWDGKSGFLECKDFEDGKTVRLLMDGTKNAYENAMLYYENYKKAQSGSKGIVHDIELLNIRLAKLERQRSEMLNEQNPVKIEQLLRKNTCPKQKQKKTHPGLDYVVNGWSILVGRDANENDELLRHHVRGSDVWLHVRDFPGGYVFIKSRKDKTVPLEVLLDAGNLAVYYSKARNSGKTDLYYTNVKYLRRAKNGPKGLVIPTHEKNLCINPDKSRLERLESLKLENSETIRL